MRRAAVLLAGALLAAAAAPAPAAAQERCAAPPELGRIEARLPRTAQRLQAGTPLTIVAIGSSSTAGFGASTPAKSYPARLAAELERRFPRQPVRVHNKGVGGEVATDMMKRFDRDVLALHPDLVVWQVGSNSVLRDEDVERAAGEIRDGVRRLKAASIDVVLMTTQYAPKILARPFHGEMEQRLDRLGREERVGVFHRFALMHHWVSSGQLDFKKMLSPDGLHLNDLTYDCVARHLAAAIAERAGTGAEKALTSQR